MFSCTYTTLFFFQQHVMISYAFTNTLYVKIQTDLYPGDTEWYLYNSSSNNHTIIETYDDYEEYCSQTIQHISIPDGCYTLQFYDTFGDGICCGSGYGRYEVKLNDTYLTFANLQTYEGYGTQIYFCTRLFQNMSANSSKALTFTTNDNSKIVIKNNNNRTLYLSYDFVPFGDAYDFLLPVDQVYQILIYKKSNNKWKEIEILSSSDDWDFQMASYVEGICMNMYTPLLFVIVHVFLTLRRLSFLFLCLAPFDGFFFCCCNDV